jgi:REG-2-like HAD superfamily hydrolase
VLRRPKALFLDACGTFLIPSEPVTTVYNRYAEKHGVHQTPQRILQGFRHAYNAPPDPRVGCLRYNGDARDFWRRVVFESLGTSDDKLFQEIYDYYSLPEAWELPPGLRDSLTRIRGAGVKICVVSNFDRRLRHILRTMDIEDCFDDVVVSCEVGAEKPNPAIFDEACRRVGLDAKEDFIIHVGDDRRNDVWGARDCGITAWLWGEQISTFEEIADRIVTGYTAM